MTPISVNGGRDPTWAPDGAELYYVALPSAWPARLTTLFRMMAVTFDSGPPVRVGQPRLLFEGRYMHYYPGREHDIAPDGERFLLIEVGAIPPAPVQLNLVFNLFEELNEKVPTGSR